MSLSSNGHVSGDALRRAALEYAELGYSVFPLAPRTKLPRKNSHGLSDATIDVGQIERWWDGQPTSNIGIRTDGLVVIDVDLLGKDGPSPQPNPWFTDDRARGMAQAPLQRTWSGGRQFIFRQPAGKTYRNTESEIAENIDTRANGGYIVAAPSFVKKGVRTGKYSWAPGCELDMEPDKLPEPPKLLIKRLDEIEASRAKPKGTSGGSSEIITTLDIIPEGKRNSTLASLAGAMRSKGFTAKAIEGALLIENTRCRPPLPESEVRRIAESFGRYEPTQDLSKSTPAVCSPVLVNLASVEPKTVTWLWPNRIPIGKVTLIVGEPGTGKSQLSLDVTSRVSTGAHWPDDPATCNPVGSVVLLSAEDDIDDTIVPRLIAAGANRQNITAIQGVEYSTDISQPGRRRCFNLERDLAALEQAISAQPNCRLVVIDPISAFLGQTDSHKNADIRGLLTPLAELAAKRSVAVVAISHLNKMSGTKAMHRITGSLAFVAAARAAWLVIADKDDVERRLFLPIKNNLSPVGGGLAFSISSQGGSSVVAWKHGVVSTSADEALERDEQRANPREGAKAWLRRELADGPRAQRDLDERAKQAGHSWRTVRRASKDLEIEMSRSGFGEGSSSMWRLPETSDAGPCHQ